MDEDAPTLGDMFVCLDEVAELGEQATPRPRGLTLASSVLFAPTPPPFTAQGEPVLMLSRRRKSTRVGRAAKP